MDRTMAANVIAIIFAVIAVIAGGRYCWKALTHRIAPRFATWLIFLVASGLSLASYMAHHAGEKISLAANVANRVDVVELVAIIAAILWSSRYEPGRRHLKMFDWWCFVSAAAIVAVWAVTGSSFTANLLLQTLMCVGYFPTIQHLLKEKKNTEPFDVWCANLGIAMLALIPSLITKDVLGIIYAGRAVLCVAAMIFAMWYFGRRAFSAGPR